VEYRIEPSDDGQYIVVTMVGDITRPDALEVTRSMFELGKQLGIGCYLLDASRARNMDSPTVNVRFARDDIPEVWGPAFKTSCIALLVDPADHSHDFYAAFAGSRGIETGLFWDRDEAIAHLEEVAPRVNTERPD
jgi:hypothetical protein